MADRYTTLTQSVTVAAGGNAQMALTLPYSILNIVKLKMSQSDSAVTSKFAIYKSGAYTDAKKVYATLQYTGALVDPVEDTGVLSIERNQGFVCAYEDESGTNTLWWKVWNTGAVSCTYSLTIEVDTTYSHTGGGIVSGVPEQLTAKAYASYLTITTGVVAKKNNATIDQAEFRAIFVASGDLELPYYDLRTVAEGGTFAHDGSTRLVITGISATMDGAQYIFTSDNPGTWYYAWRLHNGVGWSVWTDGNSTPSHVTQFVKTRNNTADVGPPSDWDIVISDGPVSNSVIVDTTRPRVNGDIINWYVVQIKDGSTGAWTTLLNGPDANNLKYDGRGVNITLSATGETLTKTDGLGWGTAAAGDLVLLDVRGNGTTWDEAYCQWGTIWWVRDVNTIYINGHFRPQAFTNMQVVIVKPPWSWSTGGYLGGYAGHGFWPQVKADEDTFIGDTDTQQFKTSSIIIPSSVSQPEARVWFENNYSRNDDGINHTTGMVGLPTQMTWTKFNNTRWWIPKYDNLTWCDLNFNAAGSMNLNAVNPRGTANQFPGIMQGVQGHFSVFPDGNGLMTFRAKWENVYLPGLPKAGHSQYLQAGLYLVMGHKNPKGYWYTNYGTWIIYGRYRQNDVEAGSDGDYNRLGMGSSKPTDVYISNPDFTSVYQGGVTYQQTLLANPTPPYTLEIRYGYSTGSDTGVGTHDSQLTITTLEYRIGGTGSYTAFPNIAIGPYSTPETCNLGVYGLQPFLGLLETYVIGDTLRTGYTARLTEFEVIYGVIRQHRLV